MCLRELVVQVVKVQFFDELFLVVGLRLFAKISLDLEVPGLAERLTHLCPGAQDVTNRGGLECDVFENFAPEAAEAERLK